MTESLSLQDVAHLATAPTNARGEPVCLKCTHVLGCKAPYSLDIEHAPEMVVDEAQPIVCACHNCGAKAQTPFAVAAFVLGKQLAALREVWCQEQLAKDPHAAAIVASPAKAGAGK